jgi:SAM-dependent methyltransferase
MISYTGYWTKEELHQHEGTYSENLAEWVSTYFFNDRDKQVIDFGCGLGTYSRHLQNRGFDLVIGIEGTTGEYLPSFVKKFDLSFPISSIEGYPSMEKNSYNSLCLEVGEHIPSEYESIFLDNLSSLTSNKIILSWAVRGQLGHGHVNCLNNGEVIDKMSLCGFIFLKDDTEKIRREVNFSETPWLKETIMIFKKDPLFKSRLTHFYQTIGEDWMDFQELYSEMVKIYPDNSHFVEIGSWKGRSSSYMGVEIIRSGKKIKFDCIDPWMGDLNSLGDVYDPFVPKDNNPEWLYLEFMNNIGPVSSSINPIRLKSIEAVDRYEDRSLDFVFIDGSHEYGDVKEDISVWYPKVKKGGTIAGHDYTTYPGVKKAVDEFFNPGEAKIVKSYWVFTKK